MRAIPGLIVFRPGDANEVTEAWRVTMELRHETVAMILGRQALPTLDRAGLAPASGVAKGAYVLSDASEGDPEVVLIASGTEVSLCLEASEQLSGEGLKVRVVSMPSWDLFEEQIKKHEGGAWWETHAAAQISP